MFRHHFNQSLAHSLISFISCCLLHVYGVNECVHVYTYIDKYSICGICGDTVWHLCDGWKGKTFMNKKLAYTNHTISCRTLQLGKTVLRNKTMDGHFTAIYDLVTPKVNENWCTESGAWTKNYVNQTHFHRQGVDQSSQQKRLLFSTRLVKWNSSNRHFFVVPQIEVLTPQKN